MQKIDITIHTWMSYDPVLKKYYLGTGFDGIDHFDEKQNTNFIKDMLKTSERPNELMIENEPPESGYHRAVLMHINHNMKTLLSEHKTPRLKVKMVKVSHFIN